MRYIKRHWLYILLLVALLTSFTIPAIGMPVSEPPGAGGGLWEVDGTETQLITADEVDMQTKKIINVVDPAANQDAATKKYVDDNIYPGAGEQAFLDADHSKLDGIELLADVTDAANVATAGALMVADLENPPTEDETSKSPTSEWAFDHNAASLGSSVHNIRGLAKAYLGTDQENIAYGRNPAVQLDTLVLDVDSCFDFTDWYGASGAYRQADADSSATKIEDDDANFPAYILGAVVKWASNAAGDTNTGGGCVSQNPAPTSTTLTIAKTYGADFAGSYYYWIKKAYYVAPVTGYYPCFFQVRYGDVEADKRYGIYIYVNGIYTIAALFHASVADMMRLPHNGVLSLTAGDVVTMHGYTDGTNAVADIENGVGNTVMTIYCLYET